MISKKIKKIITKNKKINKKLTYKKGKTSKMEIRLSDYKAPSILGDENRFFKGQLQNEKENFFFK